MANVIHVKNKNGGFHTVTEEHFKKMEFVNKLKKITKAEYEKGLKETQRKSR